MVVEWTKKYYQYKHYKQSHKAQNSPNKKFKDMSRTNTWGQGRGRRKIFEDKDKDEDKILAPRATCSLGLNITDM